MTTLAINLRNSAGSQFTNYDFKSFVKVGDTYLGAKEDGLFTLDTKDSDNEVPIDSKFCPIKSNLGIEQEKRVRCGFIQGRIYGELKVITSFDDRKDSDFYESITSPVANGQQTVKFSGTRFQKGAFLELEISNVDGCDFSIDNVYLRLAVVRSRPTRISRIAK
jgi:hypothetical protein